MVYRFAICSEAEFRKDAIISSGEYVVHLGESLGDRYIDLRLKCGEYLTGWRIYGCAGLVDEMWGEAKLPHNPAILVDDTYSVVERGMFRWYADSKGKWLLELEDESERRRVYVVERSIGVPAKIQSIFAEFVAERGYPIEAVVALLNDGIKAREWIVTKICGIGRFVEGDGFCEEVWREVLMNKCFTDLSEYLAVWEKRLSSGNSAVRLTKPAKLSEVHDESDGAIRKLLELVGEGR